MEPTGNGPPHQSIGIQCNSHAAEHENATVQPSSRCSLYAQPARIHARVRKCKVNDAQPARSHSSPPTYVRTPGLTSCQASRLQDKPRRRPDRFIRSQSVRRDTPIVRTSTVIPPMSTPIRSSFRSSSNSSFQKYARRLPAVRMARTKQTARKDRDDQHRGRSQQEGDRHRDRSPTPPRRARPRSPSPERLECAFCGQVNYSRRNHRRHLITRHKCHPDGTPATPADVEDAQRGDPAQPAKHDTKYKSREFVDTDSDDDTTPAASGASTPSDKHSPSPPRDSTQRVLCFTVAAPRHVTRRVPIAQSVVTSYVTSRDAAMRDFAPTQTSTKSPIRAWYKDDRRRKQGTSETTCSKVYTTDGNRQERHVSKVPDFSRPGNSAVGESGNSRNSFSSCVC